ncbi:MAG: hypothetical protein ISQ70_08695 [Pirellulales bacterium]|nr:hypothetical protein [Pirellulales bacterium]
MAATRRDILSGGLRAAATTLLAGGVAVGEVASLTPREQLRAFLGEYLVSPATLHRFLDPHARTWARFHPTYGYLLRNSSMRDGVDGASTLARYEPSGQRKQVNFPTEPCRIHTYGDSFTQGHQVSDGETWQEVLAAHFCEPIRNFGVGGFGVYQAAMRLLEIEQRGEGAEYLILTVWGDDHFRSIYPWRWLAFPENVLPTLSGEMFHANPWIHAALDFDSGQLIDKPNVCPDEKTLERLSNLDWLEATFASDPVVQLLFARATGAVVDREPFDALGRLLGQPVDLADGDATRTTAQRLLHSYGVRVGMRVLDRLQAFALERGKQLMVVLSYPVGSVWHACSRTPAYNDIDHVDWHPQEFRDHLASLGIPCVDSMPPHVAEFDTFRLSAKDYVDRYYIGHYNPRGNHFFAYALKDPIRDWLSPRPPAYRAEAERLIRFEGYLPG